MTVRALLIAIPHYPESKSLPNIETAADEVHRFAAWLRRVKGEDVDIEICDTAERTTRSALNKLIGALAKRGAGRTSEFYFYFSGHGATFSEQRHMAPLLLTSDFAEPQDSGLAVLAFDELRWYLLRTLGRPGQHFYFIDACRNAVDSGDLAPTALGLNPRQFEGGVADCCHTLFSTAPDNFAVNNAVFSEALLAGLEGRANTKVRVKQGYAVTFHRLEQYLEQKLGARGESASHCDGILCTGLPGPRICLRIRGAGPHDRFRVELDDGQPPRVVEFAGPSHDIEIAPGWYAVTITSVDGTVTPADPQGPLEVFSEHTLTLDFVELTDEERFALENVSFAWPDPDATSSNDPAPERAIVRYRGTVRVSGPALRTVKVVDADGELRAAERFDASGRAAFELSPGDYQLVVEDLDGRSLVRESCLLRPTEVRSLTLVADAGSSIHASILRALGCPADAATARFPSVPDDVAERDLGLWLALLATHDILRRGDEGPDPLALSWTEIEDAALYVLLASDGAPIDVAVRLEAATLDAGDRWGDAHRVPELVGVYDARLEGSAGPHLLACRIAGGPVVRTATHLRRGHVTLVTLHRSACSSTGFAVHQYFVPLLAARGARAPGSGEVQQMWRVQREFARGTVLMPDAGERDRFLTRCIEAGSFEPLTAMLAVYELLRRGASVDDPAVAATIAVLADAYADLPDVAWLQALRDRADAATGLPMPMFAEALTLGDQPRLPAVRGRRVFDQLWTTWMESPSRRPTEE